MSTYQATLVKVATDEMIDFGDDSEASMATCISTSMTADVLLDSDIPENSLRALKTVY